MPKISVDGTEYQTEDLTDNAKAQVASLQFLETHIAKLKNDVLIYKTARQAYTAALKAALIDSHSQV